MSIGVLGVVAAMFALSWWFDRRQRAHGLFAAQALAAAIAFPGFTLGFASVLGPYELLGKSIAMILAAFGAIEFTCVQLRTPPRARVRWGAAIAVSGAVIATVAGSRIATALAALVYGWFSAIEVVLEVRSVIARGARRLEAAILLASWSVVLLAAIPHSLLLLGHHVSFNPLPIASALWAALHAFLLVAERTRALDSAETLHRELSALDNELRRQLMKRAEEIEQGATRLLSAMRGPALALPAIGSVIDDRYEVVEELGQGGMGVVLAARRRDGGEVALKVLRGRLSPDTAARFAREARAAALVRHRNVVGVLDLGLTNDGAMYLVMERVHGQSLAAVLAGAPPFETRRGLAADVVAGLVAIHAAGVVHRDLKPSNVLVTRDGTAKISDFGIAALARSTVTTALGETVRANDATALTGTLDLVGTPAYMAPEQATSRASPASDVFALGLVLYEIFTGQRAFTAPPVFAPADLSAGARATLESQVGPDIAAVISSCLALDASHRPPPGAVAQALASAAM